VQTINVQGSGSHTYIIQQPVQHESRIIQQNGQTFIATTQDPRELQGQGQGGSRDGNVNGQKVQYRQSNMKSSSSSSLHSSSPSLPNQGQGQNQMQINNNMVAPGQPSIQTIRQTPMGGHNLIVDSSLPTLHNGGGQSYQVSPKMSMSMIQGNQGRNIGNDGTYYTTQFIESSPQPTMVNNVAMINNNHLRSNLNLGNVNKTPRVNSRSVNKIKEYSDLPANLHGKGEKLDKNEFLVTDINTNEKVHACDIGQCDATFKRFEDLARHRRMHSSDRPYACDYPGCDFTSKRKDNLQSHKKTHETKKHFCQFVDCQRKDRGFTRRDELKRHYESHIRKLNKKIHNSSNDSEKILKLISDLNTIIETSLLSEKAVRVPKPKKLPKYTKKNAKNNLGLTSNINVQNMNNGNQNQNGGQNVGQNGGQKIVEQHQRPCKQYERKTSEGKRHYSER